MIERIRRLARYKGVPIIVLSGQASEANRARATKAGATAFLSKPPDADGLMRAIEQATGRPRPKVVGQAEPPAAGSGIV